MASRYPSQHQRPPPPYPSGGPRQGLNTISGRGGGNQTYSGRGRGPRAQVNASSAGLSTASGSGPSNICVPQTLSNSSISATVASNTAAAAAATSAVQTSTASQQTNDAKILSNPNPVCLCKIGQGTVQDIVSMTHELFGMLKTIQPPNTTSLAAPAPIPGVLPIAVAQEKSAKSEEHLKEINLLFKKLKVIYKSLQPIPNDDQGLLLLEIDKTQNLIPMKRKLDGNAVGEENTAKKETESEETTRKKKKFESQAYMQAARELAEVKEKLRGKNQELKSIIDDMRTTVWEINSMLGMRTLGASS